MGIIMAITSAVLYGLMPLLTKTIYESGSNSFTVAFLRMCIGTFVFCILFKMTAKSSLKVTRAELKQLIMCAAGYGITPVLLYTSYNYLASGLATTLHFVYPVFVVLGSVLFRIERFSKRKGICCVLCMLGILLFYTPGGQVSLIGILIALASGVVYAYYGVYLAASDLLQMDAYKLSFWKHLLSAVIVGVFALAAGRTTWPGSAKGWTFALLLGLLTAASSFLYQQATKYAGAPSTAMLSTFEPLTSVVVGYFVYAESLTLKNYAGIVCILLSVILLSIERKPD